MKWDNLKIIIINGFLGSGKTTFIQKCLRYFKGKKVGLIVNEFGDICIDNKLIADSDILKREIHSGSIFCSCKEEEFIIKMKELITNDLDLIFVESSGFSNPTSLDRIINFITVNNNINAQVFRLTICDAKTLHKIVKTLTIVEKQIECSDLILLNKIDLVNEEVKFQAIDIIRNINPKCEIISCSYCEIDYEKIFMYKSNLTSKQIYQMRDISLRSIYIEFDSKQIFHNILAFLSDLKDLVYRVKGFIEVESGENYFIEIASGEINYRLNNNKENKIIILYSSKKIGLEKIKEILYKYIINGFSIVS